MMKPLAELRDLIRRRAGTGTGALARTQDEVLGLKFAAARSIPEPQSYVYEPIFCLVAQGEKQIVLGDKLFTVGTGQSLVVSVDLPITAHISRASSEVPYLFLGMMLEPAKVATLLLESTVEDRVPGQSAAMGVTDTPSDLLDALLRLVRLLDHPRDLRVLGPLAQREILWRLLCSEQGHRVRQIGLADSRLSQIGRAIRWLRNHYDEPVRIEDLARLSAMSVTSFYRQFRAVALMSPLQYLKQIRLQQARARLLAGADDVAMVGHAVGYDSASQFSREYKRAYGAPPGQDARLLRASHRTAQKATTRIR